MFLSHSRAFSIGFGEFSLLFVLTFLLPLNRLAENMTESVWSPDTVTQPSFTTAYLTCQNAKDASFV